MDKAVKELLKPEKIRNIGIMAHIDAGKTTTTERMLYYAGKIYKLGEVDEGTATMDWMEVEQKRGITITAATTTISWNDHYINIIDTPGHVDFTIEVERSLRILDGGVCIFCAVGGVEPQSETVWRQAQKYKVPRIIYINKMDKQGADFFKVVEDIKEKLQARTLILQIPITGLDKFRGVIDIVGMRAILWEDEGDGHKFNIEPIPKDLSSLALEKRRELIETLADFDDELLEKYIHDLPIDEALLKKAIRTGTVKCKIFPVLCGASFRNKGVQPLLDAIVEYLPAPVDLLPVKGKNPKTHLIEERRPALDEPFCGLIFKISSDCYTGNLYYTRIYSGILRRGAVVYNARTNKKTRIMKIVKLHANKRQEVDIAFAGDIVGVIGPDDVITADTLCDINYPIVLESIDFPEPVMHVAIEPKTNQEIDRLGYALEQLAKEDPTFRLKVDKETGQTIISGMGELHLEILIDRLMRDFSVNINIGKPQVSYKETIKGVGQGEGKFIRQTGGRGQYGHVWLRVEPMSESRGIEFINDIKGGVIPKEYIDAVEKGIYEGSQAGILAGYPIVNIRVTLFDGSYHQVDSSELAFKNAALIALREALKAAEPILLEPIMKTEITTPTQYLGDVIQDLTSRRAQIVEINTTGNMNLIKAHTPLAELFNYASVLRSISQGRATYNIEFLKYKEVDKELAYNIISGHRLIRHGKDKD